MSMTASQPLLLQKGKLEAENDRLRLELEAVRADRDRLLSSQQASTSGQTAFGWRPPVLPAPKQPQAGSPAPRLQSSSSRLPWQLVSL